MMKLLGQLPRRIFLIAKVSEQVSDTTETATRRLADSSNDSVSQMEPQPSTSGQSSLPLLRSKSHVFDSTKCIFCYCKKKRGDTNLINVCTWELHNKINDVANTLGDEQLHTKIQGTDLIAKEAKYHKNCLGNALNKAERKVPSGTGSPLELDTFSQAYQMILDDISPKLQAGVAFEMSELITKFRNRLSECECSDPEAYRPEKLKSHLQKHFGSKITFHIRSAANKSELVYSSSITLQTAIGKRDILKQREMSTAIEEDLELPKKLTVDDSIYHTAEKLRCSIDQIEGLTLNPCVDSSDICGGKAEHIVPHMLYNFLSALMTGKLPEDVQLNPEQHRRVLAIAQDIIYTTTNSRCKTPKHVGLAMSIKHLTGSRQIISMLHGLGHSVSYDDVVRIQSAIATHVMSSVSENVAFLPTNIFPGSFAHAAMDNIDINEETRSGAGTTHVLGSFLYQEKSDVQDRRGPRQKVDNTRRKSVEMRMFDLSEYPNKFRRKTELKHLAGNVDTSAWQADICTAISIDTALSVARLCPIKILEIEVQRNGPEQQAIPGWSGFHAIINYKFGSHLPETVIGYNPVVRGTPADLDTIYTGLKIIEKQMRAMGQDYPVTTLDLQLYIVAQNIRFRNMDELGHHVIRLGGFHILELYWKILGKRYSDCGLADILVESQVFGPNATKVIMQGGNYKRCSLAHKLMQETLCRLRIMAFLRWLMECELISREDSEKLEELCQRTQDRISNLLEPVTIKEDIHGQVLEAVDSLLEFLLRFSDEYAQFIQTGEKQKLTMKFLNQYIKDIDLALAYIEAEKIPSWEQHLKTFREILCYAFAYDRQNYGRWGPVYLAEMFQLAETAPPVYTALQDRKHVVTRSSSTYFNSVWSDLG